MVYKTVKRLQHIPGFSIDRVAKEAGADPEVLRLENLDTDLRPPQVALDETRAALERDDDNSYLPFTGSHRLREAVAKRLNSQTGHTYGIEHTLITCGGTEGLFDAILGTTDPGDEVVVTDPTYAGMVYRVSLAGAVHSWAPFVRSHNQWRLDLPALKKTITTKTRVLFIMNPSMPSGAVLSRSEWDAIADLCRTHDLWLIYNAAMERILYDNRSYLHPASLPGMAERTITIGSVSKEFRMIGWRVGWVVGPHEVISDIARVHIYNAVTPTGIAQAGARAALETGEEEFAPCLARWQSRRDMVDDQLKGLPNYSAAGGWSQLLDVGQLGFDSFTASNLLLEKGKVAATPMRDWGHQNSDRFVRLVFSNEPVARLADLRQRVRSALNC